MNVIIENPQTGQTRVLLPDANGRYPNFQLPWHVQGPSYPAKEMAAKMEAAAKRQAVTINVDDKMNKIAAWLGVPLAEALHIVGRALGIQCAYCQLRYQIWQKAKELGWRKVMWLTWKSVRAQANCDESEIKAIAEELES
jgi:hypothetical protein